MRESKTSPTKSVGNMVFQGVFWLALLIVVSGCDTRTSETLGLGGIGSPRQSTTANPESYALIGRRQLDVSVDNGVLANDVNAVAVTAATLTTINGGTLQLNEDGSFSYSAPENFFGTDQFEYTLEMNGQATTGQASIKVYPEDATPVP